MIVKKIRPTLKVLRQLPRDSFPDPTIYDKVAQLKNSSRETRERIVSSLRLYSLEHPLLQDARQYFDQDTFPNTHGEATKARSKKNQPKLRVYEVRDYKGAAWRGAVICDKEGNPWLVYANAHDKFHAAVKDVFSSKDRYYPTSLDYKIRDTEEKSDRKKETQRDCLAAMVDVLATAVHKMPKQQNKEVRLPDGRTFDISLTVMPSQEDSDIDSAHEELGEVTLLLNIDAGDKDLSKLLIGCYIPFLQPDPELWEPVYGSDFSKITFSIIMTYSQLAQALVTSKTDKRPEPVEIPAPEKCHYFDRHRLVDAFVLCEPLPTLCGQWIVPTRDGAFVPNLPICKECESQEPAAQMLLNIIRDILKPLKD